MRSELDELHALADAVLLPSFEGPTLPDLWFERLSSGLGGITLFATNVGTPEQVRELTARIHEANPDAVIAVDEEGGDVTRLQWAHGSSYPGNLALGRVNDVGLTRQLGEAIGADLARAGIDLNLAPSVDVNCEPDNPVIGPRAWGTTPADVAAAVGEIVRGYRAGGVASCLKHFPGHGDTRLDSHLTLPACDADAATLESRELHPFRANFEADSVMSAHVVYDALDPGVPGTYSRAIATTLLRERLGFAGVCVTDALEMEGAAAGRTPAEAGAAALAAGCDLLLYAHWSEGVRRARFELADALVEGRIDRAPFDASRPRLASFDAARPAPGADELATPLESLTPADWTARLERIVERGLVVRGRMRGLPAGAHWSVDAPAFAHGGTLDADLASAALPMGGASVAAQVIAICSRKPIPEAELAALRARCAERPTVLVGLQNDAFLARVPEAAVTISASDATPLVRRVVARRIAALAAGAHA